MEKEEKLYWSLKNYPASTIENKCNSMGYKPNINPAILESEIAGGKETEI